MRELNDKEKFTEQIIREEGFSCNNTLRIGESPSKAYELYSLPRKAVIFFTKPNFYSLSSSHKNNAVRKLCKALKIGFYLVESTKFRFQFLQLNTNSTLLSKCFAVKILV